jgi:hypothetical protein
VSGQCEEVLALLRGREHLDALDAGEPSPLDPPAARVRRRRSNPQRPRQASDPRSAALRERRQAAWRRQSPPPTRPFGIAQLLADALFTAALALHHSSGATPGAPSSAALALYRQCRALLRRAMDAWRPVQKVCAATQP